MPYVDPLGPGYTRTQRHGEESQYLYDDDPDIEYHLGEDWANGSAGGTVSSIASGRVIFAGFASGYGPFFVAIEHDPLPDGRIVTSYYGHMGSMLVSVGQQVSMGQAIGTVGSEGIGTGAHLHFAIFLGDNAPLVAPGYTTSPDPDPQDRFVDPSWFFSAFANSATGPNLVIENVSIADPSVAYGETIQVTYDVVNIGNETAGNHLTRLVIRDASTGAYITEVLDDLNDGTPMSITPGARVTVTTTINTVDLGSVGDFTIHVIADHTNAVSESNEGDNDNSAPVSVTVFGGTGGPGPADLYVIDVALDDTEIFLGGETTIEYFVGNRGNTDAPSSRTGIYISTDATFDSDDDLLDSDSVVVDSGELDYEAELLQNLANYEAGTYWLFVVADINADISESNEGNNVSSAIQITILPPPPDLVAHSLVVDSTVWVAGDLVGAEWVIENVGQSNAAGSASTLYLSTDPNVTTDDIPIIIDGSTGTMTPGEINPEGGGSNGSDPYLVPSDLAPGTYYLAVIADSDDTVSEGDEGNNRSNVIQITVEAPALPDLRVFSFTWGRDVYFIGDVPEVGFQLTNDGPGAAEQVVAQLYLSRDGILDSTDILLATAGFASVQPGELTSAVWALDSIPADVIAGEYYGLIVIDPSNSILESNEENNIFFSDNNPFVTPIIVYGQPIEGTPNADSLIGTSAPDQIFGLGSDDVIMGYAGNDILDGGLGDDIMVGGLGDDIYVLDTSGDTATENAGEGNDTLRIYFNLTLTPALYANFERAELYGDGSQLFGNTLDNVLVANDDRISVLRGEGGDDTLIGGSFRDILSGGSGVDTLTGGGGNDRVDGGAGADIMIGGTGDDAYFVEDAGDVITELDGEGTDLVNAFIDYTLTDNVEVLYLRGSAASGTGNALDNSLYGSLFVASTLSGLDGEDVIVGGLLGDTLSGGNDDDRILGLAGDDVINGDDGNDTLSGGGGADDISGGTGDDTIYGSDGNDILSGDAGVDRIFGGQGADTITGGADRDIMTGEAGADIFAFADGDFAGLGIDTADRIVDFASGTDQIDLSGVDAITGGSDDAFTFIADAAFSGTAGELRWEHVGNNTMVYMDVDGDGAADYAIRLDGTINLAEADFVL